MASVAANAQILNDWQKLLASKLWHSAICSLAGPTAAFYWLNLRIYVAKHGLIAMDIGHWTKATQIGGRIIAFGKCFSKNEMKLKLPLLTLTNRRSFLSCLCNFIAQLKTYARARVLVSETLPPAIASHRNDVGETKKTGGGAKRQWPGCACGHFGPATIQLLIIKIKLNVRQCF